jgi:Zn-finger nucleic acid-binding protein
MKCPIDDTDLVMTERQGIEIDYCPKCRGVWLDRGELDKIIERSALSSPPQQRAVDTSDYRRQSYDEPRHRAYDEPRHRKRKSLLGEIFDF